MSGPFAHIPGVKYPDPPPKTVQYDGYLSAAKKRAMNPPLCAKVGCTSPALHCCPATGYEDDFYHQFCPEHKEQHLIESRQKYRDRQKKAARQRAEIEPLHIDFKIDGKNRAEVEAAAKASGMSIEEWAANHLLWAAALPKMAMSAVEKQEEDFKAEVQRCLDKLVADGKLVKVGEGYALPSK